MREGSRSEHGHGMDEDVVFPLCDVPPEERRCSACLSVSVKRRVVEQFFPFRCRFSSTLKFLQTTPFSSLCQFQKWIAMERVSRDAIAIHF